MSDNVHEHMFLCCRVSARRAMDHRRAADEERITWLETLLKETSEAATESERKYEEVCFSGFLWSPYVIGQTIIFSSCFFFLLSFFLLFFLRLISAVGNWMFTILWHMVWP